MQALSRSRRRVAQGRVLVVHLMPARSDGSAEWCGRLQEQAHPSRPLTRTIPTTRKACEWTCTLSFSSNSSQASCQPLRWTRLQRSEPCKFSHVYSLDRPQDLHTFSQKIHTPVLRQLETNETFYNCMVW